MKNLFEDEEAEPQGKKQDGCKLVVMSKVAVQQRINTHGKGHPDHAPLKKAVVDDVDTQNWEAGNQYRQQCAMDGTGYGSNDSHQVPIDFCFHVQLPKVQSLQCGCKF